MTPPLFTQRSAFGFAPMWYWLHSEACGLPGVRSEPVDRQPWPDSIDWFVIEPPVPPAQGDLFTQGQRA